MPEAGLAADQHLVGAEYVSVGASGWLGYPLPFGRSDELTLRSPGHGSGRQPERI